MISQILPKERLREKKVSQFKIHIKQLTLQAVLEYCQKQ